jgi:hypothetical protein
VKDSDSSPDKTENSDDMSLADLLGAGDGKSEEESPRRVEHRDDEPDSGMVNLAKMVAASSVEVAKMPSLAPPPPPSADQSGVRPIPAADPSGVVPTQGVAPIAAAPAQKKSNGAIYALIAIVILAAVVIGYFVMNKGGGGEDTAAMKMMAEMQAKAEADRKAAEEKEALLMAKLEEMSKAAAAGTGAVSAEDQAKMDAVKAQLDAAQAEKEAAEKKAEEAKSGAESGTGSKAAAEKPKKDTTTASDKPKAETPKKPESTATGGTTGGKTSDKPTETAKTGGGGSSELDSLLGGGKAKEEEKPATKPVDDLPAKPSKDQVTAAMAPIKAKAQASCAKYSTGVVQVSMVVTSEGKVKSATPTGVFAGNPAGTCVAMMARSAKFPKFKDPTYTFIYPITLQ